MPNPSMETMAYGQRMKGGSGGRLIFSVVAASLV